MKFYQEKNEQYVFPLSEFQDRILDGEPEIILFEMERDIGGEMFCQETFDFVGKGDCGTVCSFYNPCNGISGRCRHLKHGFIGTGRKFRLTSNLKKEEIKGEK